MRIIMIKKQLASGEPCRKCRQAQDMLERRGLWQHIDEVVWAVEGESQSPGMLLARELGVQVAPFFIVYDDQGGRQIYTSALKLIREKLDTAGTAKTAASKSGDTEGAGDIEALSRRFADAEPEAILGWALDRFGSECAIAFSGAEDVVLIDMAAKSGKPFSVFSLDTGRLHPETYQYLDRVRAHYGIEIRFMWPQPEPVEALVQAKGLFSFYDDGHKECCGIRKVEPLSRALQAYRAWVTGQRRDQSPETRDHLPCIQLDTRFRGTGSELVKLNPLAAWTSEQTWHYIRENQVPYNPLHQRGYISIGCAPCTRPVLPGQHEREGRWWWEQADSKECGLHTGDPRTQD